MIYDPNKRLSPNFRMYEVAQSMTAQRLGIDNTPPYEALEAAQLVAVRILEPIRRAFGRPFSPTSWYRCEELERVLCQRAYERWCIRRGVAINDESWQDYFSRKSHPKGEAADIKLAGISVTDLFEYASKLPDYDQMIREGAREHDPSKGWLHASIKPNLLENRRQAFDIHNP